ncbi:MAG TPA: tetratricopeptide repeat protein [Gammaproteobacteria bacterium]|nr:tetratricopeptide repeat protein [Gammaproteobacteria bacterium]
MSLLMEALKKAEAEKKKAAFEQQNLQTQRTGEHAAASSAGRATPGEAPVPPHTGTFDTSRLSLEPIERTPSPQPLPPAASSAAQEEADRFIAPSPSEEVMPGRGDEIDLAAEEQYDYGEPISLTEPPTALSETHPAPFEQTSVLMEPPSSVSSAEAATAEMGVDDGDAAGLPQASGRANLLRDTPVTAQAVFARPSRRRSPIGMIAALMVVTITIAAGYFWVRYQMTVPAVRQLPASAITGLAHGPPTLPEVQPQGNLEQAGALAPPAAEQAPSSNTESTSPSPPPETAVENQMAANPPTPTENAAPMPEEKKETAEAPAPQTEQAPVAADIAKSQPLEKSVAGTPPREKRSQEKPTRAKPSKSKGQVTAADQNQATASMYDVSPGEIKISTVRGGKAVNPKIQEAYGAYQAADYWRAEQLYREVLDKQPDQRDALLGLAAIQQRRGDRAGAAEVYGRLLHLDPNDAYAQAAWTALRREQPTIADESDLKLLLQQDPHAANVHYLLGNVYAREGRWPEAQQAYFDAYKQDSSNTDYVYNLAVSLDHLGERKTALNYYRMALDLAGKRPVNFATDQVLGRIQALSDAGGGGPP